MPYTALYRKRRPRTFGEIVGQPHVVRALVNQLVTEQVSHAYLFCGTRGTGKTSAAKILTRAVNCQNPREGEPCNECDMCRNILLERCLDVTEIDAASNNGVENIRELREEVKYLPAQGKYKVYIVDEVHMLSSSAFNALLKTLEEPPPHVIFILATTDSQKIPATILSRCQRYDFRRISAADIVKTMAGYLGEENLSFENEALDYIAYHSDGAMRDALSLLDQCLHMGGADGLTAEKARELLGAVDRAKLFELADALSVADGSLVMSIITKAMDDGRDTTQFISDLVRHFRDVLVAGLTSAADFPADMAPLLMAQSERVPGGKLIKFINAFSEVQREMRFAPHARTAFEVCALRLCMPEEPIQVRGEENAPAMNAKPAEAKKPIPAAKPATSPTVEAKAGNILGEVAANWGKVCAKLPAPVRSLCVACGVEPGDGNLKILCDNETTIALLKQRQTVIREAIADCFNVITPPNLAFELREAYNRITELPAPQTEEKTKEATEPALDDWASFGQAVVGDDEW